MINSFEKLDNLIFEYEKEAGQKPYAVVLPHKITGVHTYRGVKIVTYNLLPQDVEAWLINESLYNRFKEEMGEQI